MRALILSAGRGKRLRPLTDVTPKPLIDVGGMPMMLRQMLSLKKAGITEFVVNVAHLWRRFPEMLGDGSQWGISIEYSYEGESTQEALETRGGIVKALPLLTRDGCHSFVVAAGDIVTDFNYLRLTQHEFMNDSVLAHLVLVPNPSYHPQGDMTLDEDGLVRRNAATHTFSSFGLYRAELFSQLDANAAKLFPWLFEFCDSGQVSGELYEGVWMNVGTLDELDRAQTWAAKITENVI